MRKIPKDSKHPTLGKALQKVVQDSGIADEEVHRLSVRLLSSGEVMYRIHARDEEDYLGGYIAPGS